MNHNSSAFLQDTDWIEKIIRPKKDKPLDPKNCLMEADAGIEDLQNGTPRDDRRITEIQDITILNLTRAGKLKDKNYSEKLETAVASAHLSTATWLLHSLENPTILPEAFDTQEKKEKKERDLTILKKKIHHHFLRGQGSDHNYEEIERKIIEALQTATKKQNARRQKNGISGSIKASTLVPT